MDFSAEIGNSNSFSAQKQVISKKKKVFTEIETDFSGRNHKFKRFLRPNQGNSFTTSAPKSLWGGLFSFFEQKSASKAPKNVRFCVLFRPVGKVRAPPDYATASRCGFLQARSSYCNKKCADCPIFSVRRYLVTRG